MSAEAKAERSEALARRLAELADSKAATEIVVLDMRELVSYTDFLTICTARNERQARAIADEVKLRLKQERQLLPGGSEAAEAAGWIVLDYLDCVLHVFTEEERQRYQLEDLWREAPRLELPGVAGWRPRAPLRCRAWVASSGRSSATAAPKSMRRLRRGTHGTGRWSAMRRRRSRAGARPRGRCRRPSRSSPRSRRW